MNKMQHFGGYCRLVLFEAALSLVFEEQYVGIDPESGVYLKERL